VTNCVNVVHKYVTRLFDMRFKGPFGHTHTQLRFGRPQATADEFALEGWPCVCVCVCCTYVTASEPKALQHEKGAKNGCASNKRIHGQVVLVTAMCVLGDGCP
jgi:hypothetical protein